MINKPVLAIVVATAAIAQSADLPTTPPSNAAAAFARIKALAGMWEANTQMGKAKAVYEITGGGSAVVEREEAENMPPMMTVYHLDGNRLMLTHYCMAGNQPRMAATGLDGSTIRFQFVDATNLANANAGHMHNATLRLIDDNRIESEWQFYEDQRPKMTEKFAYTRVR